MNSVTLTATATVLAYTTHSTTRHKQEGQQQRRSDQDNWQSIAQWQENHRATSSSSLSYFRIHQLLLPITDGTRQPTALRTVYHPASIARLQPCHLSVFFLFLPSSPFLLLLLSSSSSSLSERNIKPRRTDPHTTHKATGWTGSLVLILILTIVIIVNDGRLVSPSPHGPWRAWNFNERDTHQAERKKERKKETRRRILDTALRTLPLSHKGRIKGCCNAPATALHCTALLKGTYIYIQ